MTRLNRPLPFLIMLLLMISACSSGGDGDDDPGDVESSDTETQQASEESESASGELTCDETVDPSSAIRATSLWLPQISDAESEELAAVDYEAVLAAIDTLRPIQDIEGVLGTMRQGLDNLEADIIAVQEGRYDDKVGGYGVAAMNAVIGEEICGG